MYAQALALAVTPLLILTAAKPVEEVGQLQRRQSAPDTADVKWKNPTGGNIQVGWADQGLQFGGTKPQDIINNHVASICSSVGTCIGGENVALPKSGLITGGEIDELDITMTVTGDYPTWAHNGLVQMLAWSINNQTKTNHACSEAENTNCVDGTMCPAPQQTCGTMYQAPGSVAVVLAGNDAPSDAAPGYINVQFTITKQGDGGLCSTMTTMGSGLSGFLGEAGGPVGGLFTLASLFCNL